MVSVSIVIPAYNEEKRLKPTLKAILSYFKKLQKKSGGIGKFEVLVVDDGSKDGTVDLVRGFKEKEVVLVQHKKNLGKGGAVRTGFLKAKHDYVLFSDSDLATPIVEFEKFLKEMMGGKSGNSGVEGSSGVDVVIASRNLPESDIRVEQPWYRRMLGNGFPLLVNMLLLPGIKDTQCGFKLFRKEVAKKVAKLQTITGFAFDVEQLLIAKKLGCKVREVPVVWVDQEGSTVDPLRHTPTMFRDVCKIRMQAWMGKYRE